MSVPEPAAVPEAVAAFMERARAVRRDVRAEVAAATPEELAFRPEGRWSARDVLVHVGNWEAVYVRALGEMLRGEMPAVAAIHDFDAWNAEQQARQADLDVPGAIRYWEDTRRAFAAALEAWPFGRPEDRHVRSMAQAVGDHEAIHLHQLREALAWARGQEVDALLHRMAYMRHEILSSCAAPPEALEWRPAPEAWSAREMLIHLAIWDRHWARVLRATNDGRPAPRPPFGEGELDRWNAEQVAARRHWTLSEVLHEFGAARGAVEAEVGRLTAERLADARVRRWVARRWEHDGHHKRQIEDRLRAWRRQAGATASAG